MKLRINKEKVSHIKLHDFYKTSYVWCDRKVEVERFLWFKDMRVYREGYWRYGEQSDWSVPASEEYIKKCIVEDGVLVEKPEIEIFYGKHKIGSKIFETLLEAQKFCNKNFPNVSVIM